MNGLHDLGGLTTFGPIGHEDDEPVFHEEWQRRVFAMGLATLAFLGPVDRVRHAIERMDPVDYLSTSYYEHWLAALLTLAGEFGYLTRLEVETGQLHPTRKIPHPAPDAEAFAALLRAGMPANRDNPAVPAAFRVGDKVRARNMEITGHTRLVRYVRGRVGVITALHGAHVFADTYAHDQGESPRPLYTVRFEAKELWGDNVNRRDCVHVDLWETYLESVSGEHRRT